MLDKTSAATFDADRAAIRERDGFIHLPGVIPPGRVERLLEMARDIQPGQNMHETSAFAALIEGLKVQNLVQSLFAEPIYYFGYTTVMREVNAAPGPLHDDAKGPKIPADGNTNHYERHGKRDHNNIRDETWPVWRLFIYLNDHVEHSGGTKCRKGSYKKAELFSKDGLRLFLTGRWNKISLPFAGYVNPKVKPGDAVLFNLRTRHAGHYVRLRFTDWAMPTLLDNLIKRLTLKSERGRKFLNLFAYPFPDKRTSLVVDFATESDWARGFQANRLLYPANKATMPQFFDLNKPEFVARLRAAGVRVLNAPALPTIEAQRPPYGA
jgi:hypothetical protein